MNGPLLLALPGSERFAARLAVLLDADTGAVTVRRFPDGETYARIESEVAGRSVALVWSMRDPDPLFPAAGFLARTAAELGAAEVGLVAPYLAYLRQDRRFAPGEAVASRLVAAELSRWFSWLVTVEPHLHRLRSLDEIFSLRTGVAHVAVEVARWIRRNVAAPLVVGPDEESTQWVAAIAREADAPHAVLAKRRRGDRDVEIAVPPTLHCAQRTPVLVDDILASAQTMAAAVRALRAREPVEPVCIGIHAVFGDGAEHALLEAGAVRIVTTDTIVHPTNGIEAAPAVAVAVRAVLAAPNRGSR